MGEKLSEERLSDLNGFISALMGLYFTPTRLGDLERGIQNAARDFGFDDPAAFVDWLKSRRLSKEHVERLAYHLTVGETYFFRDSGTFSVLENRIFPELISARRDSKRIRVWSAGCSTGEEAYSVAILLKRLIPDIRDWNVGILATDINPRSLKKAAEGAYTEWSFRETPGWLKDLYFRRGSDGTWRISAEIRNMVSFAYLNLAEDIYPSLLNGTNGVDIIFCRNVIMYFSDLVARSVVKGMSNSLVEDGWLLVSPAEAVRSISGLFAPVNIDGAILYRKTGKAEEASRLVSEGKTAVPAAAPALMKADPPPAPKARQRVVPAPAAKAEQDFDIKEKAAALYGQGLYQEAAGVLESLKAEERKVPEMLLLARAYANMGRLEEASMWCESIKSTDTLNKAAYTLLATIRQEEARVEEAITNLKKAVYLDQDFIVAHFMLGKLLMARPGSEGQARRHFRTARALLDDRQDDELLPESDGLMAGRLREILDSMLKAGDDV